MGKTSAAEKMKAYRWILLLLLITIPLAGCSGKTAKTILKEAAPDVLMNAFSSSSAPKPTLKQVPEMEVPAKQGSAGTTAVQQNDNLDIYIHRKDDYNQEISALAASINSYLGTHANFKNEEQLIPRGQRLANDIKASRQVVAGMDTTQTARKRKLLELLDTARAMRVLALGLDGEDEGVELPEGGKPGLACLLRLPADNVDKNVQRLEV